MIGAKENSEGGGQAGKAFVYHGSADGLSEDATWTFIGEDRDDYFGVSVAGAGDVKGDGYAALIVGADNHGELWQGSSYVFHGSASGLSPSPDWIANGENKPSFSFTSSAIGPSSRG